MSELFNFDKLTAVWIQKAVTVYFFMKLLPLYGSNYECLDLILHKKHGNQRAFINLKSPQMA